MFKSLLGSNDHQKKVDVDQDQPQTGIQSRQYFINDVNQSKLKYASANRKRKQFRSNLIKMKQNSKDCWNISATTMTRDQSPSFSIPKSIRFSSLDYDMQKNGKILSLQLRGDMRKGSSFTKSKRKENWVGRQKDLYPSGATYFSKQENYSFELNPENKIIFTENKTNLFGDKNDHTYAFAKCQHPEKRIKYHGRRIPPHTELTKQNPGVGKYYVTNQLKNNSRSYTMRKMTKRFNEHDNEHPSPSSYKLFQPRPNTSDSINAKGTFPRSLRTFLANPDNHVPAPNAYQK